MEVVGNGLIYNQKYPVAVRLSASGGPVGT